MATLIFDIETIGEEWNDLDGITQKALTRWIDRTVKDERERKEQLKDIKDNLCFSPLTGRVVSLGLYDLERHQGAVYYTGEKGTVDIYERDFLLKQCTEEEMLEDFWEGAKSYDTFVTFNGRRFDIPFILNRSVVHGIVPTQNLTENRYLSLQKTVRHVDLQDQLTFYGAMYRRPSLHMFCRAFGIVSPKGEVSGDNVAELFQQKKFRDIAHYNIKDVIATTELYQKWYKFLAPESFKVLD